MIIGLAPAALTAFLVRGLPLGNLAEPAAVAAVFALLAWRVRGVRASGTLAGFGVAFTLYARLGWRMFAALFAVFVLTWAATRAGARRKSELGPAEARGGRDAGQVTANVGLAAWAALLSSGAVAATAALAVLAEAAADTCSSELGKAYGKKTVLVTTGEPVAPGTDGGISLLGTASGQAAAVAIAACAAGLGLLGWDDAALATLVALAATFLDSLLGATLERRGWLNNDAVNFLSTASAGAVAGILCVYL